MAGRGSDGGEALLQADVEDVAVEIAPQLVLRRGGAELGADQRGPRQIARRQVREYALQHLRRQTGEHHPSLISR